MGVCLPAGLGMPWNPLARAGGNVQVKGSWVSLLRLLHLQKYEKTYIMTYIRPCCYYYYYKYCRQCRYVYIFT